MNNTVLVNNYDSFTHNVRHLLCSLGATVRMIENDQMTVEEVLALSPDRLVISPGPCSPAEAGISVPLIVAAAEAGIPLLGICLGHQAIGAAFGGKVIHAQRVVHGESSIIRHTGNGIFSGIAPEFSAVRYHSLAVERHSLPDCLQVTAWTDDDEIMGLQHCELPIFGIQFHPESFQTDEAAGAALIRNFLG